MQSFSNRKGATVNIENATVKGKNAETSIEAMPVDCSVPNPSLKLVNAEASVTATPVTIKAGRASVTGIQAKSESELRRVHC